MKKKFDKDGLLFVIREIGKGYKLPFPQHLGFCSFCLGANTPNQRVHPKGSWCCGSWCDDLLPPLKICNNFRVDKDEVKRIVKLIRPDGNETMSAYEHMKK